jgi:hypothetical protein
VGKPEGKKLLGRSKRRWEHDIKKLWEELIAGFSLILNSPHINSSEREEGEIGRCAQPERVH